MKELILRPFEDNDILLMKTWLNQEYILKWYHEPREWLEEVEKRNTEFFWIHHFIVMKENMPIGFCQYYDCFDSRELEDWYTVSKPKDLFSIDYLIGNEHYLGKGYGKEIVKLLCKKIEKIVPRSAIVVQPEADNYPSKGALEANGFEYCQEQNYYFKQL